MAGSATKVAIQTPPSTGAGPENDDVTETTTHLDDDLADFARRVLTLEDATLTVHVAGTGPAVIVMPEMPGISPDVARFARWVRDAGFTVWLPSLFGVDGAYPTTELGEPIIKRACVSKEFRAFAGGGTSPVVARLRALARLAHEECGWPGVGAGGLELSPADADAVRSRLERDDLTVLGYRFDTDRWCTEARFAAYEALLGPRFDGRVIPGSVANPDPPPFFRDLVGTPHSVVTAHLVDEAGHPTVQARDEILAYLSERLHG
jgi:hypothetical protein